MKLNELVSRFITAVTDFLATKPVEVDSPPQPVRTQNPFEDIKRHWEQGKLHFAKVHQAALGAESEVEEHLQQIVWLGSQIVTLTDDPHIVEPVTGLAALAKAERAGLGSVIARLGNVTSLPTFLEMLTGLLGFAPECASRRSEMAQLLDALTAYYLLRLNPPQSA